MSYIKVDGHDGIIFKVFEAHDVYGQKLAVVGAAHLGAVVADGSGTHHKAAVELVFKLLAVEVEQL